MDSWFVRPSRALCGSSAHNNMHCLLINTTTVIVLVGVEGKGGLVSIQRVEWTNFELRWALFLYFAVLVCESTTISSHPFFFVNWKNSSKVQLRQNQSNSLPRHSSSEHKQMTNKNQMSQWSLRIVVVSLLACLCLPVEYFTRHFRCNERIQQTMGSAINLGRGQNLFCFQLWGCNSQLCLPKKHNNQPNA
jgi:hypothetical protein